jgi:hypothetical protein
MALLDNLDSADQFDVVQSKIDAAIDTINDTLASGATGEILRKVSGSDFDFEFVPMAKQKIIEIGFWNMVSTGIVNIPHGLSYLKIVGIRVLIINDGLSIRTPLDYFDNFGSGDVSGGFSSTSTNVDLFRTTGANFDDADYNSASINRGYIIIDYID